MWQACVQLLACSVSAPRCHDPFLCADPVFFLCGACLSGGCMFAVGARKVPIVRAVLLRCRKQQTWTPQTVGKQAMAPSQHWHCPYPRHSHTLHTGPFAAGAVGMHSAPQTSWKVSRVTLCLLGTDPNALPSAPGRL